MKVIDKTSIQRIDNSEGIKTETTGQEKETQSGNPDSYLDLDVSVLRNRGGYSAAIMDKSGIRIFDDDVERRLEQHLSRENEKLVFYRSHVFSEDVIPDNKELEAIKKQVFSSQTDPVRGHVPTNQAVGSSANTALFLIILTAGAMISLVYGRFKKKEREKRIADLNNRYEE